MGTEYYAICGFCHEYADVHKLTPCFYHTNRPQVGNIYTDLHSMCSCDNEESDNPDEYCIYQGRANGKFKEWEKVLRAFLKAHPPDHYPFMVDDSHGFWTYVDDMVVWTKFEMPKVEVVSQAHLDWDAARIAKKKAEREKAAITNRKETDVLVCTNCKGRSWIITNADDYPESYINVCARCSHAWEQTTEKLTVTRYD